MMFIYCLSRSSLLHHKISKFCTYTWFPCKYSRVTIHCGAGAWKFFVLDPSWGRIQMSRCENFNTRESMCGSWWNQSLLRFLGQLIRHSKGWNIYGWKKRYLGKLWKLQELILMEIHSLTLVNWMCHDYSIQYNTSVCKLRVAGQSALVRLN